MSAVNDRYARHRQIDGLRQQALSDATVIVLGAGATGNELLKNLALLGVGRIEVYDRDTIEGHNLTRSVLFRDSDVASSKVEVAAARARELDPNIAVIAHHGDLYDTLTIDRIRRADCVIIGLDALEPRLRVNQLCRLASVPLINTAIDHRSARVAWHPFTFNSSRPETACLACNISPNVFSAVASKYSCGSLRKALASDGLIPTTIITSSIVAGMATALFVRALHDEAPAESWVWSCDSKTGQVREYVNHKDAMCPYCSEDCGARTMMPWAPGAKGSIRDLVDTDQTFFLLDSLIDTVVCPSCEQAEPATNVYLTPAHHWTDQLVRCPACGNGAREVSQIRQLRPDDVDYYCEYPERAPLAAYSTMRGADGTLATTIIYRQEKQDERH